MNVVFLGCGNMGAALVDGLLKEAVLPLSSLSIVERSEERTEALKKMGLSVVSCVQDIDSTIDLIVLAIKPQVFSAVTEELSLKISSNTSVLSIMAGVSIDAIRQGLKHEGPVVRSMPNLAVQLSMGMALYTECSGIPEEHESFIEKMFGATGEVLKVSEERLIDAGTAISGSGPAYVFYFIEYMKNAATSLGFSSSESDLLIYQTMLGALKLWNQGDESPDEWRRKVTSKGGTTEAAISSFEASGVGSGIEQGLERAFQRAVEISMSK